MICSCAPMFKFFCTPPDGASTEYQISNREFSDFLQTYYCDFLSNVYRQARFFSVVLMGNVCISCRYCTASKEALLLFLVIIIITWQHVIKRDIDKGVLSWGSNVIDSRQKRMEELDRLICSLLLLL